jgi:hypothetical protein
MNLMRTTLSVLLASATLGFGSIDFLEQRFYEEESFTRISEYFTGVEVSGNRIIIRSDPEHRTGHYITFQLSGNHSIDHFKLEVYEFGEKKPKDYLFNSDTPVAANQPIFLGLTGGIWGEKLKPPVAYKLSIIGTAGNTIESATSFLWGDD